MSDKLELPQRAQFYRTRALEAEKNAMATRDERIRNGWFLIAQEWIRLAESCGKCQH